MFSSTRSISANQPKENAFKRFTAAFARKLVFSTPSPSSTKKVNTLFISRPTAMIIGPEQGCTFTPKDVLALPARWPSPTAPIDLNKVTDEDVWKATILRDGKSAAWGWDLEPALPVAASPIASVSARAVLPKVALPPKPASSAFLKKEVLPSRPQKAIQFVKSTASNNKKVSPPLPALPTAFKGAKLGSLPSVKSIASVEVKSTDCLAIMEEDEDEEEAECVEKVEEVLVPAKKSVAWTIIKPETIVRPAVMVKATLATCAIVEEEEEEVAPIAVLAHVVVDIKIAPDASPIKARNIKKRSHRRARSRSVGQQDEIKKISVVVEENAEDDRRVERRLRNLPESFGVEWKMASWFVKRGIEVQVEDLWEREEEEEVEDLQDFGETISFGIAI